MALADVNGAKLWYQTIGQGEPLLLHHGYTACRDNWQPVAERLKDDYQVIMMECRGAGESEDTAGGYNLNQYAADVIGLVDYLGIDTFTYAGHSMGGGIGYLLAVDYMARLNKLILMAPIPSGGLAGEIDAAAIDARLAARDAGNRDFFKREMEAMRFRPDVQTDAWFESRVDQLMRVSEAHVRDGVQTMHDLDVERQLGGVSIPVLMIAGAVDGLLSHNLADFALFPDATLQVFSHAGHEVAIHEPDGVAAAIDNFMQMGVVTGAKLLDRALSHASADQ